MDPSYFFTPRRYQAWQDALRKGGEPKERSTVGAVALDVHGNLAAATSTGGLTNKRSGRIGDVPVIGAGTYADNATCGVSATGHGEYFIRNVAAYDISALMKYQGLGVAESAERVINGKLKQQGGDGGVVALDRDGNVAMVFNTPGMYRGFATAHGDRGVFIYADEEGQGTAGR